LPTAVLAPVAALWATLLSGLVRGGSPARPLLPVRTPAKRRRATLTALVLLAGPALAAALLWGGAWSAAATGVVALLAADLVLLMLAARRRQVLARVAARCATAATVGGPGADGPGTSARPGRRAAAAGVTSALTAFLG
jgi:hypothetical protein